MSGGSFNYLFLADTQSEALEKGYDLKEMAEELGRVAPDHPVTKYTQALAAQSRDWLPKEVKQVWHAVEWSRSCDWSEDQMQEVLDQTKESDLS